MTSYSAMRLKDVSYYQTGGECLRFFEPSSLDDLASAVKEINHLKMPYFLLGLGSNSLVMDEPWDGAVVSFRNLKKLKVDGQTMACGAGVENSAIAVAAHQSGLEGAGWMYRLPGQLGGTIRMNARCYGGEISQIVTKVIAVTKEGEVREYRDKSVFYGYKDTLFMVNGDLIGEAEITLRSGDQNAIKTLMQKCETDREGKGQFRYPSCGCVFKNDYGVGLPSGRLLEESGAKLLSKGKAVVSPGHANFVYNTGGAKSRDILELTLMMREAVYQKFGAWLEYEMEILGTMPVDLRPKILEKRPHRLKMDEVNRSKEAWQHGMKC